MSSSVDLSQRMHRCVVAAEPAMGTEAATIVCRQAIYDSRGIIDRPQTNRAVSMRRRSKTRGGSGGRVSSGGVHRRRTSSRRYSRNERNNR